MDFLWFRACVAFCWSHKKNQPGIGVRITETQQRQQIGRGTKTKTSGFIQSEQYCLRCLLLVRKRVGRRGGGGGAEGGGGGGRGAPENLRLFVGEV